MWSVSCRVQVADLFTHLPVSVIPASPPFRLSVDPTKSSAPGSVNTGSVPTPAVKHRPEEDGNALYTASLDTLLSLASNGSVSGLGRVGAPVNGVPIVPDDVTSEEMWNKILVVHALIPLPAFFSRSLL